MIVFSIIIYFTLFSVTLTLDNFFNDLKQCNDSIRAKRESKIFKIFIF